MGKCRLVWIILAFCGFLGNANLVHAQLKIKQDKPVQELLEGLFGTGVSISELTTSCDTSQAIGAFDGSQTNLGLKSGVMLSTGEVFEAENPLEFDAEYVLASTSLEHPGNHVLDQLINGVSTYDACVVEFDVVPDCDTLSISYVFASEEYLDYVGSAFNDIFAFFIQGPGYPVETNIALVPGTNTPVSINQVNPFMHSEYYQDNYQGKEVSFNGFTVPLKATAKVEPCQKYHIMLAIADGADDILDSAVFLESEGISCNKPKLKLTLNDQSSEEAILAENCVNGTLVASLDRAHETTATYFLEIKGTADPKLDLQGLPVELVFEPGQTELVFDLKITDDSITEGHEYIDLISTSTSACTGTSEVDSLRFWILENNTTNGKEMISSCAGTDVVLGGEGPDDLNYIWYSANGIDTSSGKSLKVEIPDDAEIEQRMFIRSYEIPGIPCGGKDTFLLSIVPKPTIQLELDEICEGSTIVMNPKGEVDHINNWKWDLGNGETSNEQNPRTKYAESGEFEVKLTAEVSATCLTQLTQRLKVNKTPQSQIQFSAPCSGDSIRFWANGNYKFNWDFGDGNTGQGVEAFHQFQALGKYKIKLEVENNEGCSNQVESLIELKKSPIADFHIPKTCAGNKLEFENNSSAGDHQELHYKWDFGNGSSIQTAAVPDYVFEEGAYEVELTVTDGNGCRDVTREWVNIAPLPSAAVEIGQLCEGDVHSFTASSVEHIAELTWYLEGQMMGTDPHFSHVFAESGAYELQLEMISEDGCRESLEQEVFVAALPELEVKAESFCAGTMGMLSLESFSENLSLISWKVENEIYRDVPEISHEFSKPGIYPVWLLLENEYACVRADTIWVEVHSKPEQPLAQTHFACIDQPTNLRLEDYPIGGNVLWYKDTLANPIGAGPSLKIDKTPFSETFYVGIEDEYLCRSHYVPVVLNSHYPLHLDPLIAYEDLRLPFAQVKAYLPLQNAQSITWTLGNSEVFTGNNFQYEFHRSGIYQINLEVVDQYNCTFTWEDELEVKPERDFFIASAFSPNRDGLNDIWQIEVPAGNQVNLRIFNRWGILVFQGSGGLISWDGSDLNGRQVPEGVYVYEMSGTNILGRRKQRQGSITLLR